MSSVYYYYILVTSFSPGYITGFFKVNHSKNQLLTGSTGAGVCLEKGVKTTVDVLPSKKFKLKININGIPYPDAIVSKSVVDQMINKSNCQHEIVINHFVNIPILSGYGSSGSSALSLSYALNELLGLGFTKIEAAQKAHIAEIQCKTGLGTVLGTYYGGVQIRSHPGAPGIGKVTKIPISNNKVVVSFTSGSLSTSNILNNQKLIKLINTVGKTSLKHLTRDPSSDKFLELSRNFSLQINFFPFAFYKFMKLADRFDMTCSMNLFGNSLFSILNINETQEFYNLFLKSKIPGYILFSPINHSGAKLID